MWSCISVPVFVWPCSPCSPADRRPSSYLSCSLNCGPQCRDPVTFSNNREINSAPPITLSASHPANEGAAWGLCSHLDQSFNHRKHSLARTNTHTTHPMISMTASDNNTHFVKRHTTNTHISFTARVGADTNFFCPDNSSGVLVAIGSSSHGDGSL